MSFIDAFTGGMLGFMGAEQQGDDMIRNTEVANQFSAQQVAANREFQERMSGTAYQRGTADMKAAGLNPMLAYSQGGASSPAGNSAQGIAAPTVNKLGSAMQGAASAAQIHNTNAATEKTKAETENIKAERIEWDEHGAMKQPKTYEMRIKYIVGEQRFQELKHEIDKQHLTLEEIKRVLQYVENLKTTNRLAQLDIPYAVNQAHREGDWWKKTISPYMNEIGKAAGSAAQIRGMGRSAGKGITINNPRR